MLGITSHKMILLSVCGCMVGSLQHTAASPSLGKKTAFVLSASECGFWPRIQKVLLFVLPSPSYCTHSDLVLPKAEKGKLPGECLQFSLLAAGCSVYWAGEGRMVARLPAGVFWGAAAGSLGGLQPNQRVRKLCPASCLAKAAAIQCWSSPLL